MSWGGARHELTLRQITQFNLSASRRLAFSLEADYAGSIEALLGDFELAFILFLTLASSSGFEHWKSVIHLVTPHLPSGNQSTHWPVTGCFLRGLGWPLALHRVWPYTRTGRAAPLRGDGLVHRGPDE